MKYDWLILRSMAEIFLKDRNENGDKSKELLERLKSEHGYTASESMSKILSMANFK